MNPNDIEEVASSNISQKLALFSSKSDCSMHKVHAHLRNINPKAYEPEIVAIGPYHHDRENLKMMEEHKLRYLHLLLHHKNEDVKKYVSSVVPLAEEARKCYAEPVCLVGSEFIEMMVLDGCFIIELVRKCSMDYLRERNDPIFRMEWMMNSLQRDLMLFENQIPFMVLCKLFDQIEIPDHHTRLIHLLLKFFQNLFPGSEKPGNIYNCNRCPSEIKHLLDLMHSSWHPSASLPHFRKDAKEKGRIWRFISTATELRETNVKFARKEKGTVFHIEFEHGVLRLPHLIIEDRTESFLRNMIAYEQYFHDHNEFSFVLDYVMFLNCLIHSSRDVEILCRHGIFENWLGDDKVVADIFNKLTDSITGPGKNFIYSEICDAVNIHCNKNRNRWMAKLRRNYLNSPWAIISIVVAVIVLLLTVIQAVFSILQVVLKK